MANFDQQNQIVKGNQYNADEINFGAVQDATAFVDELKKLQRLLDREVENKSHIAMQAIDAKSHLKKAILVAEQEKPERKTLVEHLTHTKELVVGSSDLVSAIGAAIMAAGGMFS